MAIKQISEIGSKVIRNRARTVQDVSDKEIKKTIKDLVDTMREVDLVGMAAPQIGIAYRIFVTEIRKTKFRKNIKELDSLRIFINPVLKHSSKKLVTCYEGCGSVACGGLFGPVKRSDSVVIEAIDEYGEQFELKVSGLLARVIQHEIDHLNGICFIDRVSDTKKLLGKNEYMKLKNEKK